MSIRTQRVIRIGAFLAPVMIVKGAAFYLGSSTAGSATASVVDASVDDVSNLAPPILAWTDKQLEAAARAESLTDLALGAGPMSYRVGIDQPVIVPERSGPKGIDADPPTRFNLSLVMASGNRAFALISGRRYSVGDTLPDSGWTITDISVDGRSVTIENGEFELTHELNVPTAHDE